MTLSRSLIIVIVNISIFINGWTSTRTNDVPYWLQMGHNYLAQHKVIDARDCFYQAWLGDNTNEEANFMLGSTRIASLFYLNESQILMDGFGISQTGRDLYNWYADFQRDEEGRIILPVDSPTNAQLQQFLVSVVQPQVLEALNNFNNVSSDFNIILPPEEFGTITSTGATSTEFDYGDVCLARSVLSAGIVMINIIKNYNVDVDIDDIVLRLKNNPGNLVQDIINNNPALLKLITNESAPFQTLKPYIEQTVDNYFAGINFIRNETDDQSNDFITFYPEDEPNIREIDNIMEGVRNSLNGETQISAFGNDFRLNLVPFIEGRLELRNFVPHFNEDNSPDLNTLPDPTFAGVYNAAHRIEGEIIDAQTEKPVSGASVQLDGGALRVFTNACGKYYFYDVARGWHKLQVWGFAYEFKEIDLCLTWDLNVETISLGKVKGTVVGRLVDSQTGDPLAAATVQLNGGSQWRTLTDEQGNFMLICVTPGSHQLQSWGYAYTFQEKTIDVNSTGPTDVGSLAFSVIPDTARGQVVDKNTVRPIMNAHVQFDGGGAGKETLTNITGRFILINVPAGNRQLQTWGWAYSFEQRPFTQTAGAATDIGQVQIEPIGSTVNGRLLDAVNGLPIYNATVQLDGGNYVPWKTLSLLNGDFIVYDVSGGTHQFQTWGYAYRFLQQEISCVAGQNKGMGDITLTPDPNTFSGRVLDTQTRLPIAGASVILTGNGQNISTTSFPDGRFVLLNVPQGVYDITVDAPNHSLVYFKVAHPGEDKNVELGDVLMPLY
jgi:hypothetical protein